MAIECHFVPWWDNKTFSQQLCSCGSLCCGLVLAPIVIIFLVVNELTNAMMLVRMNIIESAVVVSDCAALPVNNGRLVYVSGCEVTADRVADLLPDPLGHFAPSDLVALEVSWTVEMMQWTTECEERSTCTDNRKWLTVPGEATTKEGHRNVGNFPVNINQSGTHLSPAGHTYVSRRVGDASNSFVLNDYLLEELMYDSSLIELALANGTGNSSRSWAGHHYSGNLTAGQLYVADNNVLQTGSNIGDVRVNITARGCEKSRGCSFHEIAVQTQDASGITFRPYPVRVLFYIFGPREPLFQQECSATWCSYQALLADKTTLSFFLVFRVVCILVLGCACQLMFRPLCLGSLIDQASHMLICGVSCSVSLVCFFVVFALVWCVTGPGRTALSLVMIVVIIVGLCMAFRFEKQKVQARSVRTPYVKLLPAMTKSETLCVL